jgi:hypothetical protein
MPADPSAPGASYLAAIALQLQPGWSEFLDDCRFRLPVEHPLNALTLAATAELAIDAQAHVAIVALDSSGNADFDRAVRDAIADAAPLPAPPNELMSDDDRVHVRWLFARDRRQAGPAAARVVEIDRPLLEVVARYVQDGDLARAARRTMRAARGAPRDEATTRLMIAVLREAVGGVDEVERRVALDAIARAGVRELAPDVRAMLAATNDTELRLAAVAAVQALGDREATTVLGAQLPRDFPEHPRLALAETRARVARDAADVAAAAVRVELARGGDATPPPTAVQALAYVALDGASHRFATWLATGDARTRAAVCSGAMGLAAPPAWLVRALGDRDATVRATCADTAAALHAHGAIDRLAALARDRDRVVRAHAVAALAVLDAGGAVGAVDTTARSVGSAAGRTLVPAVDDPAAEVRAAYAAAARGDELRSLVGDRDPDVRTAAWEAYARLTPPPAERAALAARAVRDPADEVRRAALRWLDDDTALARLADTDAAPEVRGEALVAISGRRGRAASSDALMTRIATLRAGSVDRVYAALAWLLAR